MKTTINNETIREFSPCYDPKEVCIPEDETLSVKEWIEKYRDTVKNKEDVIWLLCRKEFMSDKDQRLFAVWCARESFKLQKSVDQRSIDACDVAERFANGLASVEELAAARTAARLAAESAAWSAESAAWSAESAARSAAWSAVGSAAWSAVESVAWSARLAAESAQIDQLSTYFK